MRVHFDYQNRARQAAVRVGLTLIEILMTIFVLAIGLLGVAALMPVGSYQMQRGQIAQRVSEIGPAALDYVESSGMLSPENWWSVSANNRFDDVYVDLDLDNGSAIRNAYRGGTGTAIPGSHVIEFLRSDDANNLGQYHQPSAVAPGGKDICVVRRCEPFAIDPLAIYHTSFNGTAPDIGSSAGGAGVMPRISLTDLESATISSISDQQDLAAAIFQNDEDLILAEDDDTGLPSGRLVSGSTAAPEKAKSEGNYSWLVTFSPGEIQTGSDPRQGTVSVAVFYRRSFGVKDAAGNSLSEWTVPMNIISSTGGYTTVQLQPTKSSDVFEGSGTAFDPDAGDTMRIKRRMWGLVTFTVRVNGVDHKRARWYRVGTVQKPVDGNNNIMVRLTGPDFPTEPTGAEITFLEGIEGVFTRQMYVPELPMGQP